MNLGRQLRKNMEPSHLFVEILLKESLDEHWKEWFSGLSLSPVLPENTLLSGTVADQAALHGILERIRDLNLKLISVKVKDELPKSLLAPCGSGKKIHR